MLYLDTPRLIPADHPTAPPCFRGKPAAHLMADTAEELLEYARSLGLKSSWLQKAGTEYEHFDLTGRFLDDALADPRVSKIDRTATVDLIRGKRLARRRRRRKAPLPLFQEACC